MKAALALLLAAGSGPALAQSLSETERLRAELDAARAELTAQRQAIQRQEERLRALEGRIGQAAAAAPAARARPDGPPAPAVAAAQASAGTVPGDPAGVQQAPIETVGAAPRDADRAPEVAVLGDQGSVVTRRGALTGELQFEYARADRNRAIFRGIELIESILVGVFDINESRQDVLTAAGVLRYGLSDRLEVGARLPFVYRNDGLALVPVQGQDPGTAGGTIDASANGAGIGDIELTGRYQLRSARGGWPFLIGNLQAVLPTGRDPFEVPRDEVGRQQDAATGAGFYGISPSITAILPSDPVVLFGTLGYTFNLAKDVDTQIGAVRVERVNPGDAISASAGIGIAFNQRTTLNLGYAHTWAFGTETWTASTDPAGTNPDVMRARATSRDLQVGRLLFGVTYRVNNRASLNWSVEVGATDDATDLRTVLRIPMVLIAGGN